MLPVLKALADGKEADVEKRIVLIDGLQLSELMFDFDIGTTPERVYPLKRIDGDYFLEE